MKPALIVTVDTEEEGLWSGTYRARGNTVENTRGLERFQRFCDGLGVQPTYLVDTPVVDDPRSVAMLHAIQDDGRCEVGAHLHPWCAPPLEVEGSVPNSFLCNLPERLQREKIVRLTEAIEDRFQCRPTSFRAGRYGLDAVGREILEDLGYRVDSSVVPFTDFSAEGGPNFDAAPCQPYFPAHERPAGAVGQRPLLEVPVSVGFNRSNFARAQRIRSLAKRPLLKPLHTVGVLDRLGLVRQIKFSPEQATAGRMKRLVDAYLAQGAPCMVMAMHSTSLVAGHSPYVPDNDRLEQFYRDMGETIQYCCASRAMASETLTAFAESYCTAVASGHEEQIPRSATAAVPTRTGRLAPGTNRSGALRTGD